MEPVSIMEYRLEIKVLRRCLAYAAVSPVIYNLAGTQAGTRLEVVNAQSFAPASYKIGVNTKLTETIYGGLTYLVCRNLTDKKAS